MRRRFAAPSFLIAACALLAGGAHAQAMKPGLWETKQKIELSAEQQAQMEQMRAQLAAMPPEQRAKMQEMMGAKGVSFDANGGISARSCITPQDAQRGPVPEQRGDCKNDVQRSGSTTTVNFVCSNPASKGVVEIVTVSSERYTMKMRGEGGADKRPIAMQGEGRWIAADCGSVKPRSASAP